MSRAPSTEWEACSGGGQGEWGEGEGGKRKAGWRRGGAPSLLARDPQDPHGDLSASSPELATQYWLRE